MTRGRHTCNTLKAIRKQIADVNDIEYEPQECTHEGECAGTCPACEAEVRYLESELIKRKGLGKKVAVAGIAMGMASLSSCGIIKVIQPPLAGIPVMPPEPTVEVNDSTQEQPIGEQLVTTVDSIQPVRANEKVLDGIVEEQPHFPGGQTALEAYLKENVQMPDEECVVGRVIVTFNIGKDGTISDAKVTKSLSPLCDKEALRVVNAMPKWHPGKQLGKTHVTKYTLPITFRAE
ncbi:MAG: TonB family protein [Prevotella sp.]|nr:TonB family protein [Prevotella sp.]